MNSAWMRVAGSFTSWSMPLGSIIALRFGGLWHCSAFVLMMVVVPLLDLLTTEDRTSFRAGDFSRVQRSLLEAAPLGLLLGHGCLLCMYLGRVGQLAPLEFALAVPSVGLTGVIAISASHELGHRRSRWLKRFGLLGLALSTYSHFAYYHPYHHKHAGSPVDNHTSSVGEGFYRYLVRTLKCTAATCFRSERARLRGRGRPFWSADNKMLRVLALQVSVITVVVLGGGSDALLFFLAQGVVASGALEVISYIQHHGLVRGCGPSSAEVLHDSWDCYQRFSGYLTFAVTRHFDHHRFPSKPFYLLTAERSAFVLPSGYQALTLFVLIPPLWHRYIAPILDADRRRVGIHKRSTVPA